MPRLPCRRVILDKGARGRIVDLGTIFRAGLTTRPPRPMNKPTPYEGIAFVASAGTEAQAAYVQLSALYGNCEPDEADVVVALGGDGLMLQTLHQNMRTGKPIYGMHRGTIGFLMNEYSTHDLRERLE